MLLGNLMGLVFFFPTLSEAILALCSCIFRFVGQSNLSFGLVGLVLQV